MKFRKNKQSNHSENELINNTKRDGRNIIRPSGDIRNLNQGRMIDDFSRPSGYLPSQPNINSQIFSKVHHGRADQSINHPINKSNKTKKPQTVKFVKRLIMILIIIGAIIGAYLLIKSWSNSQDLNNLKVITNKIQ